MWNDSWDPDCSTDFRNWMGSNPPVVLRQESVKLVTNFKEGYLPYGPPDNVPRHNAVKGNGQNIWIFGHTAVNGSICMYVGVCEINNEMRVLVFGPGNKYLSLNLAIERASNWN